MIEKVIKQLIENAKPFIKIESFSIEPGIYALFFCGKAFPIENYKPAKQEIIYIGKTESSQKSRDADTHFATGKTGSSTLRKTFGSMLQEIFKLVSIPRSIVDIEKKRFSHFKFDMKSEEILTEWMKTNLALSFYPYPKPKSDIDSLETKLINQLIPILNIDRKNTNNPYFEFIRLKRKQTSELAYIKVKLASITSKKIEAKIMPPKLKLSVSTDKVHKYEDIWRQVIPSILKALQNNNFLKIQLSEDNFNQVGHRKSYSFNLEFKNGVVSNNIEGSAVARDFARVLLSNSLFVNQANKKSIKLKMGKDFILEMQ